MSAKSLSLLLPDLRSGGAERVNVDLGRGFAARGHKVEFVLRNARGELLDEAREIGPVVDLNAPRVRSVFRPLKAYMTKRRPDAVLASMWPLTVAAVWARGASKVVLVEHGVLSRQYAGRGALHNLILRQSLRYAARRADSVVGVSRGVVEDLAGLTGLAGDGFSVVYNPVPVPSMSAVDVEALWAGGRGKRILTVGRLKRVKNQALLIEAFTRMEDPEARLMIVGDGDLRRDLQQLAVARGVADRVIFAGYHAGLSGFYGSADLFVLSSDREAFGNVIIEAMHHGLPVVATDCPTGPKEILAGGRFGRLTPVGDAGALAKAMTDALSNPVDSGQQKDCAAEYCVEVAVDAYLKMLLQ